MKKFFSIVMVAMIVLGAVTSCNKKSDNTAVSAMADTLSMKLGDLFGNGMGGQVKQDSTIKIDNVLKGVGFIMRADTSDHAMMIGIQLGMQIMQMQQGIKQQYDIDIDTDLFLEHFKKAMLSKEAAPQEQIMQLNADVESLLKKIKAEKRANDPVAKANKVKGEEYIKSLKANKEYTEVDSIYYKTITPGDGKNFTEQDVVMVKYTGKHLDGTVFDESTQPVPFRMQQVIPGFAIMLKQMSPGQKVTVVIPAELAYGVDGSGNEIGPNETLVFDLETVGVKPE